MGNTITILSDGNFSQVEHLETTNVYTETDNEYQLQPVTPVVCTENVVSVVDEVFKLKPMETNTPKNKKPSGTGHRVLTSPEVVALKRKERETKNKERKRNQLKKSKIHHRSTYIKKIPRLFKRNQEAQQTKFIDDFCYYDE